MPSIVSFSGVYSICTRSYEWPVKSRGDYGN